MRKFTLLGVIAVLAALAVPAAASAAAANGADCSFAVSTTGASDGTNAAYVYTGTGSTGDTGVTAVGACVIVAGKGGYAEVGNKGTNGTYAVLDGHKGANGNPAPADGYMGLSNYENGGSPPSCSQAGGVNGSTNGGGCLGLKQTGDTVNFNSLGLGAVPTPMCGDTSGTEWNKTPRDGCFV